MNREKESGVTWDLMIKNATKLADINVLPSDMKHAKFFRETNKLINRAPFIIICRNEEESQVVVPENLTIDNFNEFLGVPHASELVTIYEQFCTAKYPKEPIKALRKKCKFFSLLLICFFAL